MLTGERKLVEVNNWGDTYWGQNERLQGKNMLGRLLMDLRQNIKHVY